MCNSNVLPWQVYTQKDFTLYKAQKSSSKTGKKSTSNGNAQYNDQYTPKYIDKYKITNAHFKTDEYIAKYDDNYEITIAQFETADYIAKYIDEYSDEYDKPFELFLPYAILSRWLIITEFLALRFCIFCCVAATKP